MQVETLDKVEQTYKTPSYTRKAQQAYINRQKEKDLEAYNKRNVQYMQNVINKLKDEGKYEEFKESKRNYMREYRLKKQNLIKKNDS